MIIGFIFFLLIILINNCSSSTLLDRLRRQKTIAFQSSLSSPIEFNINEGSKFRLTCSFLSNFDQIDVFWLYNGILFQSFISQTIPEEEDDNIEKSFLVVTILSTIEIEKTHYDMQGSYLCIGVHGDIYAEQTFHVHVIPNETNSIKTNLTNDALIVVHTYQSLFEPRISTSLMCRVNENRKSKCMIQWFNPENELLDILNQRTDLVLKDANFDDHMGLYTCRICCENQCQTLTSFVYPAGSER